jgi:hypothetical protein
MTWLLVVMIPFMLIGLITPIAHLIQRFSAVGFTVPKIHIEPFFINTNVFGIISIITIVIFFATIFIGRKKLLKQKLFSVDLLTVIIYPFFAAWWTGQSAYNAVRGKKKSWR